MSNAWLTHIFDKAQVGDPGLKLLLLALADRANKNAQCWPSQADLAHRCECSPRTIRRRTERLEEMGLVHVRRRSGTTNLYTLKSVVGTPYHSPRVKAKYGVRRGAASYVSGGSGQDGVPQTQSNPHSNPQEDSLPGQGNSGGRVGGPRRSEGHRRRDRDPVLVDLKRHKLAPGAPDKLPELPWE